MARIDCPKARCKGWLAAEESGEHEIYCQKCGAGFYAWVGLRCQNQRGRAYPSELALMDTYWQIEAVWPDGRHQLIELRAGRDLYVRSGHKLTVVHRRSRLNRSLRPVLFVNHTVRRTWKVA